MHICFVCTGNICRSPMAAIVLRAQLDRAGLADVLVSSAGTGPWHVGEPVDRRAAAALRAHGYPDEHVAAQVGDRHLDADLLVALDRGHLRELRALVADQDRIRLLRSFDPDADDDEVPDPYYGGGDGFGEVLAMVEAAAPGLLDWVRGARG